MEDKKVALVTGIDGQDGSYLAELLLSLDYEVHGLVRRSAKPFNNILKILDKVTLHYGDLANEINLSHLISELQPSELYNLAAQSDVGISFKQPVYTLDVTGGGVIRLLEAVRLFSPHTKFYQASTSELFGNVRGPQNEETEMRPDNPYAGAKLYAHTVCRMYREAYGMFICCGILFNHESERRGFNFVTRKISRAAAMIYENRQDTLELGNLEARRDWGYAPDYVRAMQAMLQLEEPGDFVIGTGVQRSIKDFLSAAFGCINKEWQDYVVQNPAFYRPTESYNHLANPAKARDVLKWQPMTPFNDWVRNMVWNDIDDVVRLGSKVVR